MSGNGNNHNRNENRNSNNGSGNGKRNVDNNFHLRNPYSPPAEKSQQQQQRQQQQQQQQQLNRSGHNNHQGGSSDSRRPFNPYLQKTHQQQQRQPISNQYSTSHSSFAIKPGGPIENDHQQQHQQSIDDTAHQKHRPIENEGNDLSRHSSQPQVTQDQRPPQQQQQQQQQQDPKITAKILEEQLEEEREVNFELEASVMALQAELKHTKETEKKQRDSDCSKLEHQLRLAQQESKRWKLRATQQEKGRSIVGDIALPSSPSPQTSSAFSNRLMGNAAGLRPSSPTKSRKESTSEAKSPLKETISERNQSLPQERRQQHNFPVARLARSLLEQLKPSSMEKSDGEQSADDMSIRQVLFSIAYMGNEDVNNTQSEGIPPTIWTEGKLVEWLIATFSSKSCDRYWSALLLKSPQARKYVRDNVCLNWDSGNKVRQKQKQHHQSTLDAQEPRRRRRKNRIRASPSAIDRENQQNRLDELQTQTRQSLRNTWWNPNDIGYTHGMSTHDSSNSTTTQESSSLFFRKWATSLAASRNLRHLRILRVLLAEEAGRKDLTFCVYGQESGTWWDLCYPSIAVTIQRIVYAKLIRSKKERKKRQVKYRSPSNPPYGLATNGRNRRPRYRIGRFDDRVKKLQDVEGGATIESGVAAVKIEANHKSKSSTRDVKDAHLEVAKGDAGLGIEDTDEEKENKELAHSLSVWIGLLQVASPEQLEACYKDRTDIGKSKRRQSNDSPQEPLANNPCGGLFMVSLLLDLLEELQFDGWMKTDDSTNLLSPSRLLSTGGLPDDSRKGSPKGDSEDESKAPTKASSIILPQWYDAVIAVLTQVGKTPGGMRILRSRVPDDLKKSDFMGSALDVSIRQMHTLALHLDDARTRDGSILRFKANTGGDYYQNDLLWCGDPVVVVLLRSVEAWVRLWHQILLFVQSTENFYFRTLVLDLQDWFTSTCATLLASEEIRQEIKAMIRWQLEELKWDEEGISN